METFDFALGIAQKIGTILAILAAGYWFLTKRQRYPRANVDITVDSMIIWPGRRLVHVTLTISNIGDVILQTNYAEIRLRQVVPFPSTSDIDLLPQDEQSRLKKMIEDVKGGYDPIVKSESELPWPLLASREKKWPPSQFGIESGETDEVCADFVIDSSLELVQVYAYGRTR